MTERKVLYMDPTYGYHAEQDITSDTWNLFGVTIGAGNLAMASNRITGIPNIPTAGTDAVNQNYVDSVATGLQWREPVAVSGLVGNATFTVINGLTPAEGDSYVLTDAGTLTLGSLAVVVGDLVEFDGSIWVKIVGASGGFVPAGTRVILSRATALLSPYTDASDDGNIVTFDGTTLTGADTGETTDGSAVIVLGEGTFDENSGYVYDGTVPTGVWIQFTGAGQVVAGAGLTKTGNTLDVVGGDGIAVAADEVTVDLSATPGLEFSTGDLQVKVSGDKGIVLSANGVEIEIDATPDTLSVDADGLKVVGLPSLFKVNDVAVGAGVTAANLDTLTDTSNADALHSHASATATEAPKIEDTIVNNVIIAAGDVVCWGGANNQIVKGDNSALATSRVIGIARTGGAADPGTSEIVKVGPCTGCLSGATFNTPYFLGAAGARVLFASIPTPGRVMRLGYAINATDLDVQLMDLGYKR